MKTKILMLLAFSFLSESLYASQRVRRVPVKGDQIVTVRTSIGIATIIQVPDRPNSVVVGDQDSFRVEYLDQAITIKPLSHGAKSNLYIYTDWKRFNVELVAGSESVADYVVYLENAKEKPVTKLNFDSSIKWTDFKNKLKNEDLELSVNRLGRAKDGILLVEFIITTKTKETFKPEWLWLTQDGVTRPIHSLFLSALEISPQRSISGVLQMREVDLNTNEPLKLELRRKKISYLTISKVASWKR
ncbi:MAG: TrbG/VirB9 family P-type conjugative transfer protein [Bacteriovoracaceae bacterium]